MGVLKFYLNKINSANSYALFFNADSFLIPNYSFVIMKSKIYITYGTILVFYIGNKLFLRLSNNNKESFLLFLLILNRIQFNLIQQIGRKH